MVTNISENRVVVVALAVARPPPPQLTVEVSLEETYRVGWLDAVAFGFDLV
jgi:hypothetical protein